MQYTEIIKLLDAGYTREEIMQMEEHAAEDPKPAAADHDPKQAAADPDPKTATVDQTVNETLEELKTLFGDMKKEFTAMNIMQSRREDDIKTGDDVIAAIINPPKKNKKEGK